MLGLIYKYTSKTTKKSYIGKSMKYRFEYRQKQHKEDNSNTHFARAKRKYGYDDFELTILEDNIPKELLSEREKFWIKEYDSVENGYNSTYGGEGGNTYIKKSKKELDEIKAKISKANKLNNGNKGQYIGEKNPMYGKRLHNALTITVENIETGEIKTFERAILLAKFLGYKSGSAVTKMRQKKLVVNGWKIINESVETIENIV